MNKSHNVMYDSTTHCSSQAEVKSALVHEVPRHWEATTDNCIVKTCHTIFIRVKHPLSNEGQQVLHTLKGSTIGSMVKGSGWTLCTWLVYHEWNVVLGCGYTVTSVTYWPPVKHISPMFHQHLQYREVVIPCSIHHWCRWLQERTIKWYSHSDTGIHMLPPPIPTLTIHSPSTSHHIVHYHIGVCDRVWGGSKAPVVCE